MLLAISSADIWLCKIAAVTLLCITIWFSMETYHQLQVIVEGESKKGREKENCGTVELCILWKAMENFMAKYIEVSLNHFYYLWTATVLIEVYGNNVFLVNNAMYTEWNFSSTVHPLNDVCKDTTSRWRDLCGACEPWTQTASKLLGKLQIILYLTKSGYYGNTQKA